MGVHVVPPKSIGWRGWEFRRGTFAIKVWWHTLQCGLRWAFFIGNTKWGGRRFGLKVGPENPDLDTGRTRGWHWPWGKTPYHASSCRCCRPPEEDEG